MDLVKGVLRGQTCCNGRAPKPGDASSGLVKTYINLLFWGFQPFIFQGFPGCIKGLHSHSWLENGGPGMESMYFLFNIWDIPASASLVDQRVSLC